jgi:hypothetical protein
MSQFGSSAPSHCATTPSLTVTGGGGVMFLLVVVAGVGGKFNAGLFRVTVIDESSETGT